MAKRRKINQFFETYLGRINIHSKRKKLGAIWTKESIMQEGAGSKSDDLVKWKLWHGKPLEALTKILKLSDLKPIIQRIIANILV